MATYTKTIRSSGGDFTSLANAVTWILANANTGSDTTNILCEGDYDIGTVDFDSNALDGIVNISTDPTELLSSGMAKSIATGDNLITGMLSASTGQLNIDGFKIDQGVSGSICVQGKNITFTNCFFVIQHSSAYLFQDCYNCSADKCVIMVSRGSDWYIAGSGNNCTNEITNSVIVGFSATNFTFYRVGPPDHEFNLNTVYLYNYGSGNTATDGITSAVSVTQDVDPVFVSSLLLSNADAIATIFGRQALLDSGSPIYPFSTYGIGIDPLYYINPPAQIDDVTPTSASNFQGGTITVSGSGFGTSGIIKVNDVELT